MAGTIECCLSVLRLWRGMNRVIAAEANFSTSWYLVPTPLDLSESSSPERAEMNMGALDESAFIHQVYYSPAGVAKEETY